MTTMVFHAPLGDTSKFSSAYCTYGKTETEIHNIKPNMPVETTFSSTTLTLGPKSLYSQSVQYMFRYVYVGETRGSTVTYKRYDFGSWVYNADKYGTKTQKVTVDLTGLDQADFYIYLTTFDNKRNEDTKFDPATFNPNTFEDVLNGTIPDAVKHTITNNLTNATAGADNAAEAEDKQPYTATFNAATNTVFSAPNSYTMGGVTTDIPASNTNTLTVTIPSVTDDVVFNIASAPITYNVTFNLTHVTTTHGNTLVQGSNDITFIADTGYSMTESGHITTILNGVESGSDFYPDDPKQFTLNIPNVRTNYVISLSAVIDASEPTEPTEPVEKASNFTNLYSTNDTELGHLAVDRFKSALSGGSGSGAGSSTGSAKPDELDHGKFILELFKIPFALPEAITTPDIAIQLGSVTTTVKSTRVDATTYTVDLGTIHINEKYKNSLDYKNTDCTLYLPFTKPVKLPTELVIDQDISISYHINLYNGDTTYTLISSKSGAQFDSETFNIGSKIPFMQVTNNNATNQLKPREYNNIYTAYIQVTRSIPIEGVGSDCYEKGVISDYKGYTEIDQIEINTRATQSEQEDIKQLLRQGVYIK